MSFENGLIQKRFPLQQEGFFENRRKALKETVVWAEENIKGFVGVGLFGSLVRGENVEVKKDGSTSDVDMFVFVETELPADAFYTREVKTSSSGIRHNMDLNLGSEKMKELRSEVSKPLATKFREELRSRGDQLFNQENTISLRPVNTEIITYELDFLIEELSSRDTKEEEDELPSLRVSTIDGSTKDQQKIIYHGPFLSLLPAMFTLSVGKGIEKYRRFLFEEIERRVNGDQEEEDSIWNLLLEKLIEVESKNKREERSMSLYPKTFAEAKEKYCK